MITIRTYFPLDKAVWETLVDEYVITEEIYTMLAQEIICYETK